MDNDSPPWADDFTGHTQIVQVRIPGARRTYPYTWDGPELKAGDWVTLPGNAVSPEGTEGRVEGFGADGYTGPMKAITGVKEPQDPWMARMRQVKTPADRLQVYRRAQKAGVTGERLAALVAEGKRVLESGDRTRAAMAQAREKRRERLAALADDRDASTVSPPLTSAQDAAEYHARRTPDLPHDRWQDYDRQGESAVAPAASAPARVAVSIGRVDTDGSSTASEWGEWE